MTKSRPGKIKIKQSEWLEFTAEKNGDKTKGKGIQAMGHQVRLQVKLKALAGHYQIYNSN